MKLININGAKKPAGHYSPATIMENLIFISGQLPIDPFTGEGCKGDIKDQAMRVLSNLELILKEADSKKEDVMRVCIYISDVELWNQVNEIYASYFGEHKPARTIVPTRDLHYGYLIELDAIVYKTSN